MSQYGIHVPEGVPAQTIDEVVDAADKMKDHAGEVSLEFECMCHNVLSQCSVDTPVKGADRRQVTNSSRGARIGYIQEWPTRWSSYLQSHRGEKPC